MRCGGAREPGGSGSSERGQAGQGRRSVDTVRARMEATQWSGLFMVP